MKDDEKARPSRVARIGSSTACPASGNFAQGYVLTAPTAYLVTPPAETDSFADLLREAVSAAPFAVVRLTLPVADERTLVKRLKLFCPIVQETGAAAILDVAGPPAEVAALDLAAIVMRGGADGAHLRDPGQARALAERLRGERAVGLGNPRSRHDCMEAGEAGLDYLSFGEPRPDGSIPAREAAIERAQWWAEIFETPCAIYAPTLADVAEAVATGAEFVAVGEAVFGHEGGPAQGAKALVEAIEKAAAALDQAGGGSR